MQQTQMDFSAVAAPVVARARRTDPESSHEAARRVTDNGTAETHESRILECLRWAACPVTASEIGMDLKLTNVQVLRRMKSMEKRGLIQRFPRRHCRASGIKVVCWGLK